MSRFSFIFPRSYCGGSFIQRHCLHILFQRKFSSILLVFLKSVYHKQYKTVMDLSFPEILILCGSILLSAFLISEIFHWTKLINPLESNHHLASAFEGNEDDRSCSWKKISDSGGNNQSPINIITRNAIVIEVCEPLKWIGYGTKPVAMTMTNDGTTVSVRGFWSRGLIPCIEGGPLKSCYYFNSMKFRWGNSDDNGSDHSYDNIKHPFEMQLIHVKTDFEYLSDAMRSKHKDNVVIISYIFEIQEQNNMSLEPILINLSRIQKAFSKVYIPPVYLDTLFPLFESKYYSYNGSFTQPPYCEIVTWIIQSKPLKISSSQMAQFRDLRSRNGSKIFNSRSIQNLNDRDVFYYDEN